LLKALVEAVAEKGYAATTVSDIVARAGVSRGTFYQQFNDKEDCFLAAYMAGSRSLLSAIERAGGGLEGSVDWLRRATQAYLRELARQPAFSRAFLTEVRAVPAADSHRQEVHDWYVELMRRWRAACLPRMKGAPILEIAYEACIDAITELVARHAVTYPAEDLVSLEPSILYIQLALLGFAEQAAAISGEQA